MSTYPRRPGAEASSDAVDVVELLRDPTDQAPNVRHLRVQHTFSLMTSHELLIQPSFEGEFCQHDSVVTMMMFYRRRASPKHRDGMTEVCFCGGGTAHGWNNSTCVSLGAPLPPYIKEQGRRAGRPPMVRLGQSY